MTFTTFGQHAVQIHHQMQNQAIGLLDMRSAVSLEDRLGSDLSSEETDRNADLDSSFSWVEPVVPFAIPVVPTRESTRIRYFLDGSQRTLPGYHQAAIPIMASVTASAILERRTPVDLGLMQDMHRLDRSWLVPLKSGVPDIDAFVSAIDRAGVSVVDPLSLYDETAYRSRLSDFAGLEQAALAASRRLRRQGEEELLRRWTQRPPDDISWIVVDGALREPTERTIGVVKSFNRQYLNGDDADALFRLPAGHRSPAFVVSDRRHGGSYLVWYLRFWSATGRDPRYGLVRVEVAQTDLNQSMIDLLAAWIYAERRPRASADSRWPTLIYPIHYLEKILKGYLVREIRDWPGVRGTA